MRPSSFLVSTVFHAVAIALLLLAAVIAPPVIAPDHSITIELRDPVRLEAPRRAPLPDREGGGGGRQAEQPARQGKPPERTKARPFLPLVATVETPHLVVGPAIVDAPQVELQMASFGSPTGVSSGGLGNGKGLLGLGDGDGPGAGPGSGGIGGGNAYLGRLSRSPQLIYKEEPEYSEAARKARVQGKVVLLIDVGLDGRATNIRLIQGLGLGLDEAAIQAIERWRFRPAMAGDKPVVAPARVEVGFTLL